MNGLSTEQEFITNKIQFETNNLRAGLHCSISARPNSEL